MRRLLTSLVLTGLLVGAAYAADDPAPVELPELTEAERTEIFADYDAAMKSGQKTSAADALLPILDAPDKLAAHGEAWLKLGDLLAGFDMEYSALLAYTKAIEADPKVAATKVKDAIDLADKMGDTRVLAPALAKNVGIKTDSETRSRVAYLAARHNVQEGELGVALGMLMMVNKKSDTYLDAEALRGIVLSQQGRYNDALAPLLTAQALGQKAEKGARFDNVTTMNVARSYFGAGNYQRAVEYYAKVERTSDFWPDAWFEKAWSHFRAQDMNGSLGALMVHESPFFTDYYWPEADLLRAYSYFLMCKFKDASAEIDTFDARYQPLYSELASTLSSYDEMAGYADGVALSEDADTRIPKGVIRQFKNDERFLGAKAAIAKAEDELERLKNVSANVFASRAIKDLELRKRTIMKTEGARIVAKATKDRDQLKEMLSNLKITKLDMMQYETAQLERAAQTGELEGGDRIGQLRKLRQKPGTQLWPWQGEYWADEVGYYNVVSRPDCPDALRPKAQ